MSWSEVVQAVILVLASASLALFVWDRQRDRLPERPSVSQIFSNPYLRVFAILLMVLIVLRAEGDAFSLPGLVILIIGTTVAGADFILLLVALLKGDETFVKEHFALARHRLDVGMQALASPVTIGEGWEPEAVEAAAADRAGVAIEEARRDPLQALLEQERLKQLRLADAKELAADGAQVRVALLSAGARASVTTHPAFDDRVEPTYAVPGAWSGELTPAVAEAAVGHITAIAPTSKILPISVFTQSGESSDELLRAGMEVAIQWVPQVILLDFGSSEQAPMLKELIDQYGDTTLLVAPAGNSGHGRAEWPAFERNVLAVAAETGVDGRLAPFSSYGGAVQVAAPGLDVLSVSGTADGELAFAPISGTSVAAAIAAGVAALALSARPSLEPATLIELLYETGRPIPDHRSMRGISPADLLGRIRDA